DPSSGSAALLELARGFGELQKLGWRPRRSIILASWDAEEYGLVGSTEWVEDNQEWLRTQAIAYVNVDVAVRGKLFSSSASPLYKSLLYSVSQEVPYLDTNQTVYDHWVEEFLQGQEHAPRGRHSDRKSRPPVFPLGSGSDFTAFNDFLGISSVDLGFSGPGSVYHSNYDSFKFAETFMDPGFKIHKTLTQVWGLLTIRLADEPLVPFNPVSHAWDFKKYVDELEAVVSKKLSGAHLPSSILSAHPHRGGRSQKLIKNLRKAQRTLLRSAYRYASEREAFIAQFGTDCTAVAGARQERCIRTLRELNDKVSFFERHLLDDAGLPGRSWFKNVLVSPGLWKGYGSQTLPGLTEAAVDGDWKRFERLEKRTAEIVKSAAGVLRRGHHH
ncbi:Zn-dependent exopeptidase, partial [Martensiomyces pterosporus]